MKQAIISWLIAIIFIVADGFSTASADTPAPVTLPAAVVSTVQCTPESSSKPVFLRDASQVGLVPVPVRWSPSDYQIRVLVVDSEVSEVTFSEIPRRTRLATDLAAVFTHFTGLSAAASAALTPCSIWGATAQQERGYVVITAIDKNKKTLASVTVVTGPREHWFITAGVPVTNDKTLKYDSATGTLVPQAAQPQFYAGFAYQLGDLLVVQPEDASGKAISTVGLNSSPYWYSWQRLSVQALLQASSKPTDSFGVALGYTLPPWPAHGLGAISIFAGRFWSKEDELSGGKPISDARYEESWRVGVSFNISTALGWLKQ